jgi:hypothetical protein
MKKGTADSLAVLALFLAAWAGVNGPVLSSPLGAYPVVDARWHLEWASEVSDGNLFIYAPYFRAPLYPWVLGAWLFLAGGGPVSGAFLSMLCGAATSVLVHRLALRHCGRRAAFFTGALWSLWGTWLVYSGFMLIEPLYILLLTGSFLWMDVSPDSRGPWLLLGLASIARPGAVLLMPAGILLFRPRARAWPAFFIPLAAVWAVNTLAGDPRTLISSQGGINFYIGSGPEADGITAFAPPGGRLPGGDLPYVDNVWAASLAPLPAEASPSEVSSWWTARTLEYAAREPLRTAGLLARKVVHLSSPVEQPCNYDVYYMKRISPLAGVLVTGPPVPLPGILIWLMLPGALLAGKPSVFEKRLLVWIALLAAGLLPFFITARFRLPLIPFVLLTVAPRFARKLRAGLLAAPLGLLAGIGLALLTGPFVETAGVNMPFHHGMAQYDAGNRSEARLLFMEAWDRASRRTDGIDLNGTDALYNLGVMALEDGEEEQAAFWFRQALRRNPRHEPSRNALSGLTGLR